MRAPLYSSNGIFFINEGHERKLIHELDMKKVQICKNRIYDIFAYQIFNNKYINFPNISTKEDDYMLKPHHNQNGTVL